MAREKPVDVSSTATSPTAAANATVATESPAKFVPKVVKLITVPLLKLKPGVELFCKVLEPMKQADAQKRPKPLKEGEVAPKPPMLLIVSDLQTGEICQIIPGQILQDIFTDKYPNDSYVGKGFWIVVGEKKGGGSGRSGYNTYTVSEIEVPA